LDKGVTLLELVLALGLLLIIITSVSAYNANWYLRNNLDGSKNMLISSVRKAQEYSIIKKNNLTWGVCLTAGNIRLFGGSCASPTIKDDFHVSDNVTLSGLSTVTFSSLRGEPSSPQTITLTSGGKTYTIVINSAGGMTIN
jgi:Tfp pilus assembly protein FimT